jgi:uncharacterized protein YfaS (alpha-2-macroglobulin family)
LQESGRAGLDLASLYDFRARLSPWGKALLALAIDLAEPGAERARSLLSDVQSAAARTATGANWQDLGQTRHNWSTPNFTTAVVVYSLARLDPAATVLGDAVRYLVSHRQPRGAWASSYESAWVLMALVEAMRATGDLQASFDYSAALNGSPVINGRVDGPANALTPVTSTVSLADLRADAPNALNFARGEGPGRLYYRAYLQVDRPAEEAPAVQRGLSLTRAYYRAGQDCREQVCPALTEIDLTDPAPVVVRLTMTLPEDMYYVVVEDYLPAGAEVLNPNLKTSQQGSTGEEVGLPFLSEDPFARGWGWWFFSAPQVYADRVRWVTDFLPAGTYEITYRLTPFLPGEFRLLPAHAWQYYFPEVEATSGGAVITLR